MTPDEARRLLDGTTPGPWEVDHDHAWAPGVWSPEGIVIGPYYDQEEMDQWETGSTADLRLAAAAPVLAAMIDGMREEWGIVAVYLGRHEVERWGFDTREDALDEASALDLDELRIVRRYVTEPEEA